MQNSLSQIYRQRIEQFTNQKNKLQNQINLLAVLRFLVFGAGVFLIYYFANQNIQTWAWLSFVGFGLLFLYLIKIHSEMIANKKHFENLVLINQNELLALNHQFEKFDGGQEFFTQAHEFAYDLDIFGDRSIFQMLNRTTSAVGKVRLANWLLTPSIQASEILARQEAAAELKEKLDFRQHFQANGMDFKENVIEKDEVLAWLKSPATIAQKKIYLFILFFFPALALLVLALVIFNVLPFSMIFLPMLINLGIVGLHSKQLIQESAQISKRAKFLRKYALLLANIESEKFETSTLQNHQNQLRHSSKTASKNIAQLAQIIGNIDNGTSFTGLIFNGLFLWSLQYLYRLEKWQLNLKDDFGQWFEAVAEIDALSSLANLAYNQPEFTRPQIESNTFKLQAEALGHPLLKSQTRVDNYADFKDLGNLVIITGANMAGKSTYLRTVGVNLVLAMAGSVVCAKRFDFVPIAIFTSMRTKDSLQENESFFYAELKRLKELIEKLTKGERIFLILDEILKGTNSADQHIGSKALIEQLVKLKGVGLIATHDLTLGELEKQYPQYIENQCFEIEIINDELAFDYKLRKGINQNLNATFLMKKMGITV